MWTACSSHMQIFSIPGGIMLFHIYWMYNFIPSQPSLDNIHALVHCFTNSSLARREGLKFQDTVYECVRADRFSVYAKKVRWPRNFPNCTSPIMHLVCLVPKFCISVVFQFFFRWLRDYNTQGPIVWKLISANLFFLVENHFLWQFSPFILEHSIIQL